LSRTRRDGIYAVRSNMKISVASITIIFIAYSLLVFTVSSIPMLPQPDFVEHIIEADKIAHCLQYFIFSYLYFLLRHSRGVPKKAILIEIFFLGVLIAIGDELHQKPLGRHFSYWDALADLVGFFGFIGVSALRRG